MGGGLVHRTSAAIISPWFAASALAKLFLLSILETLSIARKESRFRKDFEQRNKFSLDKDDYIYLKCRLLFGTFPQKFEQTGRSVEPQYEYFLYRIINLALPLKKGNQVEN